MHAATFTPTASIHPPGRPQVHRGPILRAARLSRRHRLFDNPATCISDGWDDMRSVYLCTPRLFKTEPRTTACPAQRLETFKLCVVVRHTSFSPSPARKTNTFALTQTQMAIGHPLLLHDDAALCTTRAVLSTLHMCRSSYPALEPGDEARSGCHQRGPRQCLAGFNLRSRTPPEKHKQLPERFHLWISQRYGQQSVPVPNQAARGHAISPSTRFSRPPLHRTPRPSIRPVTGQDHGRLPGSGSKRRSTPLFVTTRTTTCASGAGDRVPLGAGQQGRFVLARGAP